MSVLRNLENKIAGLVEGTFSRAFRSEVRPVEIARRLAREMEEHKASALSHTYVPNEYRVFLSPRDRARFADYEDALASELSGYLLNAKDGPCVFLDRETNLCTVHPTRPLVCRLFDCDRYQEERLVQLEMLHLRDEEE